MPAAARAVQANGVDLVQVGHGAVPLCHVADVADRGDVAVHRIDALERDQLGHVGRQGGELAVEIHRVVVGEDHGAGAAVADALDHRGMVAGVGQHHAAGQAGGEGAERGPVGHVAGLEQQRCVFAVQVRQLLLEQHVVVVRAGDVAGSARARAATVERLVHGPDHRRVLCHAEVVVGAPDGHLGLVATMGHAGEAAGAALQFGEHAVIAVQPERVDLVAEELLVIHGPTLFPQCSAFGSRPGQGVAVVLA